MDNIKKQKNGYIALISLIIISAVVLLLVLAITFSSLTQKLSMVESNHAIRSYYLANACGHYALLKLQADESYGGNESLVIDGQSCQVEDIWGSGNENRTVFASSELGLARKNIRIEISQLRPKTIIQSWEEFIK
ncbi:MAG TPA: hypothetical protein ENN28_01075 [Candidatus Uhrbacteria bacterium]|nr:hypothetical protein [Candidatus Uhrbacteria bacterium]